MARRYDEPFILYHGTSLLRLNEIRAQNRLHMSRRHDRRVSLTTSYVAAEYAACEAVAGDFFFDEVLKEVKATGQPIDDGEEFNRAVDYFHHNREHCLHLAKTMLFMLSENAEERVVRAMHSSVRKLAQYSSPRAIEQDNSPAILVVDGDRMMEAGYELSCYEDVDHEFHNWENEIACWSVIDPLDAVLIGAEPVARPRLADFLRGRRAFMSRPLRTAHKALARAVGSRLRRIVRSDEQPVRQIGPPI